MSSAFRKAFDWIYDEPRHRTGARILQVAVGLLLLFRMASEGSFAPYFWGPNGIGMGSLESVFGPIGRLLNHAFDTNVGAYAVVVGLALSATGLVTGYATRAATAMALLCSVTLEHRLPELLDGGDNITRLSLTYMLFLIPHGKRAQRGSLVVWLHNIAVLAIMIQVCILYTTAGMMKAQGAKWYSGTALYVISQIEWFSLPSSRWLFKNAVVVTVASYATMFFQVWFPMAIFSRLRFVWVAMGCALHLGIAYTMGLVPFSLVMIGIELFMLDEDDYAKLGRVAGDVRTRLGSYVARVLRARSRAAATVVEG